VLSIIQTWLKGAVFEVQAYVLLLAAALRSIVSPPYYRRDVILQFEAIGIG
jgi:hypothetical protein